MDNTIDALRALYVALGGTAADVADISIIPDMINAIAELKSATYTLTNAMFAVVQVTRNGVALANGATLNDGDVLSISTSTESGTIKVNGETFISGGTYTVHSDVTVTLET